MSALKRLLSGHKQRKSHSLPNLSDIVGEKPSEERLNKHSRTLLSQSTLSAEPGQLPASPTSPVAESPSSSRRSSGAPHSRSGSRVRLSKQEIQEREEKRTQERLERELLRKTVHDNVSTLNFTGFRF